MRIDSCHGEVLTTVVTLLIRIVQRKGSPREHIISPPRYHLCMVATPVTKLEPDHDEILSAVAGTERLCRIQEELNVDNRDHLYRPLMELVEQGDVAIFPMGEHVQVRDDRD